MIYQRGKLVYVIRCGDFYKIGSTSDLNQRLFGLQNGTPYDLEVIHLIYTLKNGYLEAWLHKHFATQKHRGEWYRLSSEDIEWIKTAQLPYIIPQRKERIW